MKRLLLAAAVVIASLAAATEWGCSATAIPTGTGASSETQAVSSGDSSFAHAFADRAANLELEGHGTVSEERTGRSNTLDPSRPDGESHPGVDQT